MQVPPNNLSAPSPSDNGARLLTESSTPPTCGLMSRRTETTSKRRHLPLDFTFYLNLYRDEFNSLQIQLSRTQAGPSRAVKEQQEQNSPNHVQRINLISVCQPHFERRLSLSIRENELIGEMGGGWSKERRGSVIP